MLGPRPTWPTTAPSSASKAWTFAITQRLSGLEHTHLQSVRRFARGPSVAAAAEANTAACQDERPPGYLQRDSAVKRAARDRGGGSRTSEGRGKPSRRQHQQQQPSSVRQQQPSAAHHAAGQQQGADDSGHQLTAAASSNENDAVNIAAASPATAYAAVPSRTAPRVAAVAARAAARAAAAAAAAAVVPSGHGGARNSIRANAAVELPPAARCVPAKHWGLMREQLRPWHEQLLVHLCYRLQPPACYYYRDMTPHRLQRVIAARGVVERRARDGLTELLWQLERLNTWRRAAAHGLRPVPRPHELDTAALELGQLRSELGGARGGLRRLSTNARAYGDGDYEAHAATLDAAFVALDDAARSLADGVLPALRAGALQHSAWAVAEAELAGLQRAFCLEPGSRSRSCSCDKALESLEWRYPPAEYVRWRRKGER